MHKLKYCVVAILLFCLFSVCPADDLKVAGDFDYVEVSENVSDISFYEGPEDTTPYAQAGSSQAKGSPARNVIFLIGDGMGLAQTQLAALRTVGAEGTLYMQKFPVTGLMKTHSADSHITDSAAAGTAMACGIKSDNGMIGMSSDKTRYKSLMEIAREAGWRSGLVATSTISHATPASFASHVESRDDEESISAQILEHGVNVVFGGGKKFWLPDYREDERDLIEEAKARGYTVVDNAGEMRAAEGEQVLGLFNEGPLTTFSPEPSLPDMTRTALDILSAEPKKGGGFFKRKAGGFFLVVEGSQIDWACHANNRDNSIKQTLLFDLAVKEAVEFAQRGKQTLVIVTADHETGGLTVFGDAVEDNEPEARWSSGGHSAAMAPVYAYGCGSRMFTGAYDNTELAARIAEAMGVEDFPQRK